MVLFDRPKTTPLNFSELITTSGLDDSHSYISENYLPLAFAFGSEALGVLLFNLIDLAFFQKINSLKYCVLSKCLRRDC